MPINFNYIKIIRNAYNAKFFVSIAVNEYLKLQIIYRQVFHIDNLESIIFTFAE